VLPQLIPHDNDSVKKRIYSAFKRVIVDSRERRAYWQDLCQNSLREILLLLAQRRNKVIDPRIEEALRLLSEQMREPVRIEDLAKAVGLSASRLSHLFKEATGSSVIDTVNRMRLEQAALLLKHTERTASEVAYDVGFRNYNHFANLFRSRYGVTPSQYKSEDQP
jgi:AraC family transcriptional regulator of arabinose operon